MENVCIHQDGKQFRGTWLTDEQWANLQQIVTSLGAGHFSQVVKGIADGKYRVEPTKTRREVAREQIAAEAMEALNEAARRAKEECQCGVDKLGAWDLV